MVRRIRIAAFSVLICLGCSSLRCEAGSAPMVKSEFNEATSLQRPQRQYDNTERLAYLDRTVDGNDSEVIENDNSPDVPIYEDFDPPKSIRNGKRRPNNSRNIKTRNRPPFPTNVKFVSPPGETSHLRNVRVYYRDGMWRFFRLDNKVQPTTTQTPPVADGGCKCPDDVQALYAPSYTGSVPVLLPYY
jgi:hypothetical protein